MILNKEYYTQKNGVDIIKVILKPTTKFPNGYFYCPREAEDLVDKYCWCLCNSRSSMRVDANGGNYYNKPKLIFHKELFNFYHNYDWLEDIDHVNLVEIDNTNQNLNAVTHQQNQLNRFRRGYSYTKRDNCFSVTYKLSDRIYHPFSATHREDEACQQANYIDKVILKEELGEGYYRFDFLKYRRGSEDILDLERTGIISEEEATYRHILRYVDNAWYYLRYGLEQYFKDNHILVPQYSLDTNGFMIHPITGQRLCPFN